MKEIVFAILLAILTFLFLNFSNFFQFSKVEEYEFNQTYKEFLPEAKAYLTNETLKEARNTLISFKSASCPSSYPIFCNNRCYQECNLGFLKCNESKANCVYFQPDVKLLYKKSIENFLKFECEEKIDDSEEMRMFVSNLLPNFGSSVYPYALYNFKIYEWIKNNIKYLPGYANTQEAKETLRLKAGKCDDQAILFASLSSSAGSIVRIRYVENCQHAWPEVFFPTKEIEDIVNEISFYAKEESIQYFEGEDGIWIPFDTTFKIGKIVEDCIPFLNESIVKYYCKNPCSKEYPFYYNDSCYNACPGGTGVGSKKFLCLDCPKEYPFTYNNKCVSACPNGTGLARDGKTCVNCPEGYLTFNNTCVTCPEGFYLGKDGRCYRK